MTDPRAGKVRRAETAGNSFAGPAAVQQGDHNTQNITFAVPRRTVSWPYQVGILPREADCFQDRGAVAALGAAMAGGGTAVLCQVLSGTGGVGKTQLAAHHARRRWAAGDVDLVMWVTAATRAAILDAYAQAGVDILGAEPHDSAQAARAFLAWLEPKAGAEPPRSLIVLDDVADPADLRGLWPPQHPEAQTVVTTRRRDSALSGPGRHLVVVGLFTDQEATEYLSSTLTAHQRQEPPEEVAGLAADLGLLPLALSQAAAYLIDADMSCATYRRLLADRATTLTEILPDESALPDDQATILAAAWSVSVDRADELSPPGLARPLLQLIAMLDPNGVPSAVLTSQAARVYLSMKRAAVLGEPVERARGRDPVAGRQPVSLKEVTGALRVLHRLNLIDHTPGSPAQAVRCHNLIQRALRDPLNPTEYADLARIAADALTEVWPPIARDTGLAQTLRANAAVLISHAEDALWKPDAHSILVRIGQSLGETGQVAAAVAHFQRLTDDSDRRLGASDPQTLTARYHLANWRGQAGEAAAAAAAMEAVSADCLRVLGPDHHDTLTARYGLAHWLGQARDAAGAVTMIQQLLADRERVLGAEHPDTVTTRSNLAYWRGRAGDYAGAMAALEQLLAGQLPTLGPDHPTTLSIRYNVVYWRGHAGYFADAVTETEALLADLTRVFGPDHADTHNARNNLACWRCRTGDMSGIAELEELVADRLRVLGPDHRLTLVTRHNLLRFRGEAGDVAGAAAGFEQLLADRLRVLGPEHLHTLNARGERARWRGEAGDAAGAVAELEKLLADRLRILGPSDIDTLSNRHKLADYRGKAGDAAGAVAELEELLADRLRILGPDHPDTLTTRGTLAHWRGEIGDGIGAVAALEELVADVLRLFGSDHHLAMLLRHDLLRLRGRTGDLAGAAAGFRDLLDDRLRCFGPDHPLTLDARSELARWRGHAGDVVDAAALLKELLADRLRVLGPDHPDTLATRDALADWRNRLPSSVRGAGEPQP